MCKYILLKDIHIALVVVFKCFDQDLKEWVASMNETGMFW